MGLFKEDPPGRYRLLTGQDLKCVVCGSGKFYSREAQLHTSTATFFNMEWMGDSAHCAVCAGCGYIHWFLPMK